MTDFSPAQVFRKLTPGYADELKAHREDAWLKAGFSFSLAEMAHQGASAEKIAGARTFITILQNIGLVEEEAKRMPVQRLESYERPLAEVIEEALKK